MTVWAVFTAFLRPMAGQGYWEVVERAGNYGIPFAFLVMSGWAKSWREWFEPIVPRPSLEPDAARMAKVAMILRAATAMLLIGHAGYGAFMHKKMLVDQYAAVGFGGFPGGAAAHGVERRLVRDGSRHRRTFGAAASAALHLPLEGRHGDALPGVRPRTDAVLRMGRARRQLRRALGAHCSPCGVRCQASLQATGRWRSGRAPLDAKVPPPPSARDGRAIGGRLFGARVGRPQAVRDGSQGAGRRPDDEAGAERAGHERAGRHQPDSVHGATGVRGLVRSGRPDAINFPGPDSTLVPNLREGGFILVFRHCATDWTQRDTEGENFEDRSAQRNLSKLGEEQATGIGAAIRKLDIPILAVLTSPMWRCRDTGQLGVWAGPADGRAIPARCRIQSRSADDYSGELDAGQNLVFVTHQDLLLPIIEGLRRDYVKEGDCLVLRPLGETQFDVVAKVTPEDWAKLAGLPPPPKIPARRAPPRRPPRRPSPRRSSAFGARVTAAPSSV